MPLFSLSIAVLIGLCLYAGVHFVFHYRHSYLHSAAHLPYLLFSLICFAVIGFMLAELVAYHSPNVADYVLAFRWRVVFALAFLMLWPWFVYYYTGSGPRWLVIILSGYMLLQQFPNAILELGSFFSSTPVLHSKTLPWGETFNLHVKQTTMLFVASWIGIITIIIYTFFAAARQYMRGQRQPALFMLGGMSIFTLLLFENLLVATGKLNFIFLAQFGFPALLVIMSASLHMTTKQQLAQSEGKFHSLFEAAGDAILLLKDGRLIDCNPQALSMFGCRREEFLGKTPLDFSPPTQYDGSDSASQAVKLIDATSPLTGGISNGTVLRLMPK